MHPHGSGLRPTARHITPCTPQRYVLLELIIEEYAVGKHSRLIRMKQLHPAKVCAARIRLATSDMRSNGTRSADGPCLLLRKGRAAKRRSPEGGSDTAGYENRDDNDTTMEDADESEPYWEEGDKENRPYNKSKGKRVKFTPGEVRCIIEGHKMFGNNWEAIRRHFGNRFNSKRTGGDLKDKHRNMTKPSQRKCW